MSQYQEIGRRRLVGAPRSAQDDWARSLGPGAQRPLPFFDGGWLAAFEADHELNRTGARQEAWRERLWERHIALRALTGEAPRPSREMIEGPDPWWGLLTPGGLQRRIATDLTDAPTVLSGDQERTELTAPDGSRVTVLLPKEVKRLVTIEKVVPGITSTPVVENKEPLIKVETPGLKKKVEAVKKAVKLN